MPTTWTDVSQPTTTWTDVDTLNSFLLINATDFLLINSSDLLIISNTGDVTEWTDVSTI